MSSRSLRRHQKTSSSFEETMVEVETQKDFSPYSLCRNRARNPFEALVSLQNFEDSETKKDEIDELCDSISDSDSKTNIANPSPRKKKKKNKNKNKKGPSQQKEENLEEWDSFLPLTQETMLSNSSSNKSSSVNILTIEPKYLNPENEFKKIFGSKVVFADKIKKNRNRKFSNLRIRSHSHILVVPKSSWTNPGSSYGLSMKVLESSEQTSQIFQFEHSEDYRKIQESFFDAVESFNPDEIIELLNKHPYHIDGMLQLSEMCKMADDLTTSGLLIERALFAMESVFHPSFSLSSGTCRLDYRRQENRAFFIACFRHLNNVGSRACYRTALEFCKLIYNLDPLSDPLAILLLIDFYAIRSNSQIWFLDFVIKWEDTKNLSQLPNIAYSKALASFQTEAPEADTELQRALIAFPGILLPLLEKCFIEGDHRVCSHTFFLHASNNQPSALETLSKLYIQRSYHLWKEHSVLSWLSKNVEIVLNRVDAKEPFIEICAEQRRIRYQGIPRNICRHVVLVDESGELTALLPKSLTNEPILSYDPLPPLDSLDVYHRVNKRQTTHDPNAIRVFFRSLLPTFTPGNAESSGASSDLRESVYSLLDAMQNLLGNFRYTDNGNNDEGEEAASSQSE